MDKKGSDFPKHYARLRTVLDALEIFALRHCLDGTTTDERIQLADAIEADLTPYIRKYGGTPQKGSAGSEGECGEGYFNCGGICVPYQCVADSNLEE